MAEVKVVRGILAGAKVETSEENATRLGAAFEPEKSPAKKSSKSSK